MTKKLGTLKRSKVLENKSYKKSRLIGGTLDIDYNVLRERLKETLQKLNPELFDIDLVLLQKIIEEQISLGKIQTENLKRIVGMDETSIEEDLDMSIFVINLACLISTKFKDYEINKKTATKLESLRLADQEELTEIQARKDKAAAALASAEAALASAEAAAEAAAKETSAEYNNQLFLMSSANNFLEEPVSEAKTPVAEKMTSSHKPNVVIDKLKKNFFRLVKMLKEKGKTLNDISNQRKLEFIDYLKDLGIDENEAEKIYKKIMKNINSIDFPLDEGVILTEEMKQTFLKLITNYLNNFILYNLKKVQASIKRDEEPRTRDDEIEEALNISYQELEKNNTKLFDLTNYLRLKFQRKGWFISISTLMDKPIEEVEEIQKLLEETLKKKISYDLVLKIKIALYNFYKYSLLNTNIMLEGHEDELLNKLLSGEIIESFFKEIGIDYKHYENLMRIIGETNNKLLRQNLFQLLQIIEILKNLFTYKPLSKKELFRQFARDFSVDEGEEDSYKLPKIIKPTKIFPNYTKPKIKLPTFVSKGRRGGAYFEAPSNSASTPQLQKAFRPVYEEYKQTFDPNSSFKIKINLLIERLEAVTKNHTDIENLNPEIIGEILENINNLKYIPKEELKLDSGKSTLEILKKLVPQKSATNNADKRKSKTPLYKRLMPLLLGSSRKKTYKKRRQKKLNKSKRVSRN